MRSETDGESWDRVMAINQVALWVTKFGIRTCSDPAAEIG